MRSAQRAAQLTRRARELALQLGGRSVIGGRERPHHQVDSGKRRDEVDAHEFSKTALETIALDAGVAVLGHDHADPGGRNSGNDPPHVEVPSPTTPPVPQYSVDVRAPRETTRAGQTL
jgi:hypothetical protein